MSIIKKQVNVAAAVALVGLSALTVNAYASGVAVWGGTTGSFADSCEFKENTAGSMTLTGNTWTVLTPSTVKLKTRNIIKVTVESDDKLRASGVAVADAIVNYTGSTVSGGSSSNVSTTNITAKPKANGATMLFINIDGTAVMDSTDALSSGTAYTINHTVTCTQ